MKLVRIIFMGLLASNFSHAIPFDLKGNVVGAAVIGLFSGVGIKSLYDYSKRGDVSQRVLKKSKDTIEELLPKYSKTCGVLERCSAAPNKERFIALLFADQNVPTYFDELGKDIYALKKVCRSTLSAFQSETNEKKREQLKFESERLKKLSDRLSPFYATWNTRRTEIAYMLFERSLRNDLTVYPHGKPVGDSLYPVKSQHADLKNKQAQLVHYKDMFEVGASTNGLYRRCMEYLSDLNQRVIQLEQSNEYRMDCQRFSEIEPGRELAKMDQEIKIAAVRAREEQNTCLTGLKNIIKQEIQALQKTNEKVTNLSYTTKRSVDRIHDYSKVIRERGAPIIQAATQLVATTDSINQINTTVSDIKAKACFLENKTKLIHTDVRDLKSATASTIKHSDSTNNNFSPSASAPPAGNDASSVASRYPELGSQNVYD